MDPDRAGELARVAGLGRSAECFPWWGLSALCIQKGQSSNDHRAKDSFPDSGRWSAEEGVEGEGEGQSKYGWLTFAHTHSAEGVQQGRLAHIRHAHHEDFHLVHDGCMILC